MNFLDVQLINGQLKFKWKSLKSSNSIAKVPIASKQDLVNTTEIQLGKHIMLLYFVRYPCYGILFLDLILGVLG